MNIGSFGSLAYSLLYSLTGTYVHELLENIDRSSYDNFAAFCGSDVRLAFILAGAGVDLALDKFDLSAPDRFANSLPPCSGASQKSPDATLGP